MLSCIGLGSASILVFKILFLEPCIEVLKRFALWLRAQPGAGRAQTLLGRQQKKYFLNYSSLNLIDFKISKAITKFLSIS
jgi:hypothetical protein